MRCTLLISNGKACVPEITVWQWNAISLIINTTINITTATFRQNILSSALGYLHLWSTASDALTSLGIIFNVISFVKLINAGERKVK